MGFMASSIYDHGQGHRRSSMSEHPKSSQSTDLDFIGPKLLLPGKPHNATLEHTLEDHISSSWHFHQGGLSRGLGADVWRLPTSPSSVAGAQGLPASSFGAKESPSRMCH